MYVSGRRKRRKKGNGLYTRSHNRVSSRNQSTSTQQESVGQPGPEEPGGSDSSDDEGNLLDKRQEKKTSESNQSDKRKIKKYRDGSIDHEHIFSDKHKKRGIMKLGKSENAIIDSFKKIINHADKKGLLQSGSNQIRTKLNGLDIEIRVFIKDGTVMSVDGFVGDSSRIIQNLIVL